MKSFNSTHRFFIECIDFFIISNHFVNKVQVSCDKSVQRLMEHSLDYLLHFRDVFKGFEEGFIRKLFHY